MVPELPPKLCTQMPVPDGLRQLTETLAVNENHLNGSHPGATLTPNATVTEDGEVYPHLAIPIGTMWANGRTLRVKILNSTFATPKIRSKIRQYSSVWCQYANLRLVFVDDNDAEIRVNVDNSGQSWSRVGVTCLSVAPGQPTMTLGWLTDRTPETEFERVITHEFGHALGCIHEHQSPDSGIPWNREKVYKYYRDSQGWTNHMVDVNMFQLYDRSTTQFSEFDPKSIMLYAFPAQLTTDGSSTPWNSKLSEADKAFINETYPEEKAETRSFSTAEVRLKPGKAAVQRQVFAQQYGVAPEVAVGLTSLDISEHTNVRVTAYADKVNTRSADIHINTWGDTTLYSAAATWFKALESDPIFQLGQVSTQDSGNAITQHTAIPISFDRTYSSPPGVIVWLNGFEMGPNHNWRLSVTASNITSHGFTLNIDSAGDTDLISASAAWISFPQNRGGTAGGSFSTLDIHSWDQPEAVTKGKLKFPTGTFRNGPPSMVLVALNTFDMSNAGPLRLKVTQSPPTADEFDWRIETWGDKSTLFSASASYLALQYEP